VVDVLDDEASTIVRLIRAELGEVEEEEVRVCTTWLIQAELAELAELAGGGGGGGGGT